MKSIIKKVSIALLAILITFFVVGITASVMTTSKAQAHDVIPKLRNIDLHSKDILYYCIGGVVYFKDHGSYVGKTPLLVSTHPIVATRHLTCRNFHDYMQEHQGHKHE